MRVLQIIDGLGAGGAEKLILDTVPELVKYGIEVDVLLLNGERTPFYEALEATKSCRIFSLGNSFYNPFYIFKIIPYLKKYDIVHVHLFPAQYFAVLAKVLSFSKIKFVFTEHSTWNKRLYNQKLKKIEGFIYGYYDKIICITDSVKSALMNKLKLESSKLVTIENGINLKIISSSSKINRESFGLSMDDVLLIIVAGFREQKDQDTVIRSLSFLPNKYKLLLVGDGVRKDQLKTLIKKSNLEKRVYFLGIRTDVYGLLKMADIAVLSSHSEGFGLAAAEAMACGTPVIASNVPGLAQVVENGGLLFEKGNVEDLVDKILSLESISYYEEIKRSCLIKSEKYSLNLMITKIINIYRDLSTRH